MKVFAYKIQPGDTLGNIAIRYTGNKDRWVEMLDANPQIPKQFDEKGRKQFVPQYIQTYGRIFLPASWANGLGSMAGPASGQVGAGSCTPTKVQPYPGVLYLVQGGKMPAQVAVDFNQVVNGHGDYTTLNGANVGFWAAGFSLNSYGDCVPNGWKDGIAIQVPKKWLDIPITQLNTLPALGSLVKDDGVTPWTPGTGTGGDVVPGACPEGQEWDSVKKVCVPAGTATKIGATDEGFFKGNAIWWILLAGGAGIGGALLLNQLVKSKKVHVPFVSPPPALPAHVESVVRR